MTQSKKRPYKGKKVQAQAESPEVKASLNEVEDTVEAPVEEPAVAETPSQEVVEDKVEASTEATRTSYIKILGFEFQSTLTEEEEKLLNKAVDSGDLSTISKQLLYKGIQELGHIIEKQRAEYDNSLEAVRERVTELREAVGESDGKISELDAIVLSHQNTIDHLNDEKSLLEDVVKEKSAALVDEIEKNSKLQDRLTREIAHSADVTIKLDNLKFKVYKFVSLSWFSRLTKDVDVFFYGK